MRRATPIGLILSYLLLASSAVPADDTPYQKPPASIARMVEAPPFPGVSVDPTGRWMLLIHRQGLPPLSDLAAPMWRLGGYRLNPATNGRHGFRRNNGLTLQNIETGDSVRLRLPTDADLSSPAWSPNGRRFAFTITEAGGISVWLGDVKSRTVHALTDAKVNGASGSPFEWLDDERLLVRFIPEGRGGVPEAPRLPAGPVVQETAGRVAPVRTYQDLLKSPHDEARFDWIMTTQLAVVRGSDGQRTNLGAPAIYAAVDPSPDGRFWLVSRLEKPYSYLVPAYLFPRTVEIWDRQGRRVRELTRTPIRDQIPIGGVATGPRGHRWQESHGARLWWVEALDGGDPKQKVAHRDRLLTWSPPFAGEPREALRLRDRFSSLQWIEGRNVAFIREFDRKRRWSRTWLADLGKLEVSPRLVWDMSSQDRYRNPGRPVMLTSPRGRSVVRRSGSTVFLSGAGASPEGDRPFLDRMDLETLRTERLWRSDGDRYETLVRILDSDGNTFITRHETQTEPPNYFVRKLDDGSRRALTRFEDPQPGLRGIHKELVTYTRKDGVKLSATLYLPPGYTKGDRLPLIVWAYPREYNDPSMAGQIRGSAHRFTRVSGTSHLFLLTQGYALMDAAAMPVVGDSETANNTFVEQIVTSAEAAIQKATAMGVADPTRVGVGGHSYGAFMTANLLAHSDLFRAGIARSGAYNRTLTPFGFQNERRTFWEAPETYFEMSPFMHAPKIDEPILLIHGKRDNNSGTFPMQSERLYHAIKGHGGTARLVMLPYESHGYRARESVLHVLSEMVTWFDEHVKGPPREVF